MKLLIVEDERELSDSIVSYLTGDDYLCEQAFTFVEAVRKVSDYEYDCILLDLMLPGLDGFTIAKRIRETPELAATKIIMLTARTQNEDIVRGLECGADDYVTKPFDRLVLLARVRAVLRRGSISTDSRLTRRISSRR